MQRTRTGYLVCTVLAVLVLAAACGGGGASKKDQAKAEEWAWLTDTKETLVSKRQELADLVAQAEAEEAMAGEEAAAEVAAKVDEEAAEEGAVEAVEEVDLASQLMQLEQECEALTEEFGDRLVAYINADPMIEGEPPTEQQMQAMGMKSGEDIILAQEWIERGGDYKRAIEIIKTALTFDPDNPELEAALAEAEANRYMSTEKFALAEKGMTEVEVRRVLGQVNLHNLREYPDKEVVAWFYPTAEDGSAAAVWFQPDKTTGELLAYQVKFEAINPEQMMEE